MSILIEHLTKTYGKQKAVDDVSFAARQGEILGFLGPNGAGKSTTMKIAAGYLGATHGSVKIGGIDVAKQPKAAQRITGYLPEHNPLYPDMYVHELLTFAGKVNRMPRADIKKRVQQVIAQCGLTPEQNKKIGQLSKGYRQRVGLAQALLHDPEVLIMDEPTTGLDPNQILEVRQLIKTVSVNKTVLFSSHILQEVQALCDRVVLIHQGQLVADQPIAVFAQNTTDRHLIVTFKAAIDEALWSSVASIAEAQHLGDGKYRLKATDQEAARSAVFQWAAEHRLPLVGLQEDTSSLDEIFRTLTEEN